MGSNGIEFVCVHEERYKREKNRSFFNPPKTGFLAPMFFFNLINFCFSSMILSRTKE